MLGAGRCSLVAVLLCACAPPMHANASRLVKVSLPSVQSRPAIRMQLDVSAVPETELCSYNELNRPLCVSSLRSAFAGGLEQVIDVLYEPSPDARTLRLAFRVEKLSHRPTSLGSGGYPTSRVDLKWSMRVSDPKGDELLQLQSETPSPQPVTYDGQLDGAMGAMVGQTLEAVANALLAAQLGGR